MESKPKRRWYQFSLKTLLAAMTLLSLGPGGYVAHEQGKARELRAAYKTVNHYGGYFGDFGSDQQRRSPLARVILGDDHGAGFNSVLFFQSLPDGRTITFQDNCLRHLAKLPRIKDVPLTDIAVSDAALMHLALSSENSTPFRGFRPPANWSDQRPPSFRRTNANSIMTNPFPPPAD